MLTRTYLLAGAALGAAILIERGWIQRFFFRTSISLGNHTPRYSYIPPLGGRPEECWDECSGKQVTASLCHQARQSPETQATLESDCPGRADFDEEKA